MPVDKPWGSYEVLLDEERYQVKRLVVTPDDKTSLQSHEHRNEHWVVVGGEGKVVLDDKEKPIEYGDHVYVRQGQKHRIANDGEKDLVLIEVWTGEEMDEEDIERFADAYGRIE